MAEFPNLKGKAVLAPLAGVSDVAFRALARMYKAALTYTEFVSSAGVVRHNQRTIEMLKKDRSEDPSAVQIFGSSPDEIAEAAEIVSKKFDIIDINCGCPAVKVMKTGAGSSLMEKPKLIGEIIKSVCSAVKNPVTVKIRAGFRKMKNAVEVARTAESAGASAVAVHGRMFQQGYSSKADWSIIKKVRESISIPVIGNGDIDSPEKAKQMLEESGVNYVMVGRAAMGNPHIFMQIHDYLKDGKYNKKDSIEQFIEYLALAEKHNADYQMIKSHAMLFTKGVVGGSRIREKISKCMNTKELSKAMKI